MSSTNDGRSLGAGISIPQWMKQKTDYSGFDPSALSPPAHEDDFLVIRFPKAQPSEHKSLAEVLETKEQAFSKHTTSCKQFIPKIQDTVPVVKPKIVKPMGVDDGFKGDGAACGASVVAVAHQMLAGSFTTDDAGDRLVPPSYLRHRRNSKSLPASPLATPDTSPRTRRKNTTVFALQNRFFTGPFIVAEGEEPGERKTSSNWMLSGLLTQHRDVAVSTEQLEPAAENLQLTVELKTEAAAAPERPKPTLLKPKAKPSELREMNFWSPTSM